MGLNKGRHTGKITFGTFGTPCFRFHLESRGCMAETKSTHGEYTINGPKKRAIFRISSQTIDLRGRGSMILTHTYLSSEVGG